MDAAGAVAIIVSCRVSPAPVPLQYSCLPPSPNKLKGDSYNNLVRRINVSTGVVTTLAGTFGATGSADGTPGTLHFPDGVALDAAGAVALVVSASP